MIKEFKDVSGGHARSFCDKRNSLWLVYKNRERNSSPLVATVAPLFSISVTESVESRAYVLFAFYKGDTSDRPGGQDACFCMCKGEF